MLVNAKKEIRKAYKEKYAIGQFNINNLEWIISILEACQENKSPVILGVSEGAGRYMGGFKTVANMVKSLISDLNITIPVILHLDHGSSYESVKSAIESGFTSVMYDGSELDISKNVEITKKVVQLAKANNVSVEAEVGIVGGEEDGVVGSGVKYAKKSDVIEISNTGIDMLAASLGSVHGFYSGEPNLGFSEMEDYSKAIDMPLVLHGGSGIPNDMIKKAIAAGESKINVNTELQFVFAKAIRKYIEDKKDLDGKGFDPRKIFAPGKEAIKKAVADRINIFGSKNKA